MIPPASSWSPRFEQLRAAAASRPAAGGVDLRRADRLRDRDPLRARRGSRRCPRRPAATSAAGCSRSPPSSELELGSTGTHPYSDYRQQQIIQTEHYRRVEEGLKYVAWRNNTFSLHVHVGIRGADRAVQVCDRLRPVLPMLLAISANSPFLDGRDSGLHSARTQTFTKSFPRCGVPDPFGDWADVRRLHRTSWSDPVDRRVHAGVVVDPSALLVRHRRGADLRRPADGRRGRRPGGADRRLRRPGGARPRRRRPGRRSAQPADRGEHVAGAALRARRRAARPRAPRALPGGRRRSSACSPGPRRCAPSWASTSRCPRATAPSASARCSSPGMSLREAYAAVQAQTRETYSGVLRDAAPVTAGRSNERRRDERHRSTAEEELRAAYEAEIKKIRVEQILLEQVVSIINLGMRRTGLAPGTEDERDIGQVRVAIEAVRALMPLLEQSRARAGGPDPRRPVTAAAGVSCGSEGRPARRRPRRPAPAPPRPADRRPVSHRLSRVPRRADGRTGRSGTRHAGRGRTRPAQRAAVDSGPVARSAPLGCAGSVGDVRRDRTLHSRPASCRGLRVLRRPLLPL